MEKVTLHLVGGWAYPVASLEPLARALSNNFDVILHPFTVNLERITPPTAPWWLAGWSLGGMLAMNSIINKSLRPAGLILVSSTARFCVTGDYPHGVPRANLRSMIRGLSRDRDKVLEQFYAMAGEAADCTFSKEELLAGLHQLDELDLRDRLKEIDVPTLILHGGADQIIPYNAAEYLAANIPSSRLIIRPGASHALPLNETDWLAREIYSYTSF
jgi:pimeloyl-ACP methyl ester carboxylesterase